MRKKWTKIKFKKWKGIENWEGANYKIRDSGKCKSWQNLMEHSGLIDVYIDTSPIISIS